MPNEYDNEDFDSENESTEPSPKDLRALINKQSKELKDLKSQLESYQVAERKQSLANILQAKGVSAEVAEFIPADVQDEEGIAAWLEAKGKVFGYNPDAATSNNQTKSEVKNSSFSDLQSIATPTDAITDLNKRIANAKTKEELAELLSEVGRVALN